MPHVERDTAEAVDEAIDLHVPYVLPGTYRVDVTLAFATGSPDRFHRTIVVAPAPLTVAGQRLVTTADTPVAAALATFTDAGPPGTAGGAPVTPYTARIR